MKTNCFLWIVVDGCLMQSFARQLFAQYLEEMKGQ
jgi:hypothetical protein